MHSSFRRFFFAPLLALASLANAWGADYTVTTSGGVLTVTDSAGNTDTLTISEPAAGSILFAVAGRTFSVNGGANRTGDSGNIALTGISSISVNANAGDDTINVGTFATALPSITINGGAGNDTVHLNGNLTFAVNASLNLDLLNDTASPGIDAVNVNANAKILTSGTGAITVRVSSTVSVAAGASLETIHGGIVVEGNQQTTPTAAASNTIGLAGVIKTSGRGAVSIRGRTTFTGGSSAYGLFLSPGGQILSTSAAVDAGTIECVGTCGDRGSKPTLGFFCNGSISSAAGAITLTGSGGNGGDVLNGLATAGLSFGTDATITATGSASVTITATAGNAASGSSSAFGMGYAVNRITAVDGNIQITGTAGSALGTGVTGVGSSGVQIVNGAQIAATGAGSVSITATAGATTAASQGLRVGIGSQITTANGSITLAGTASTGTAGANHGASLRGPVTAAGNGNITIAGTAGSAHATQGSQGVQVRDGAVVSSAAGNVAISGAGANSVLNEAVSIGSVGVGSVSVASAARTITLGGDSIVIDAANGTVSAPGGTVLLRPLSLGRGLDLGAASSATQLALSDAALDRITCSTLTIGDANSGSITVSAVLSPAGYQTLAFARNVTFASTGGFLATVGPTTADYARMTAAGAVTIEPGAVFRFAAAGGYVPTSGDHFEVLTVAGNTPIEGAFSPGDLNQSLGGLVVGSFHAQGGTGNDLVVTLYDYAVTTSGGVLTVTDAVGAANTLTVSEPSAGNIAFAAPGRFFLVNGTLAPAGGSGPIPLAGITAIVVDEAGGDDTIGLVSFTTPLPNLTIHGGIGNDTVNVDGTLTFALHASLNLDLQGDAEDPGTDTVTFGAEGRVFTSGNGAIVVRASRSIALADGAVLETADGGILLEANRQDVPTLAAGAGLTVGAATLRTTGTGGLLLRGRTEANASSENARSGLEILPGAQILSTSLAADAGAIDLHGSTAPGYTTSTRGLNLAGAIRSAAGPITLQGISADGAGPTQSLATSGLNLDPGGSIVATGTAAITLQASTGHVAVGANYALSLNAADNVIRAEHGDIVLTGTAGDAPNVGANILGVVGVIATRGAQITTSGSGNIVITGVGGACSVASQGFRVDAPAQITATGSGGLTIAGTGGNSPFGSNHGTAIRGLVSTGSGDLALVGIAGPATTGTPTVANGSQGVQVRSDGLVSSLGGNVTITGAGPNALNNEAITVGANGAGTISLGQPNRTLTLVGDTIALDPTRAALLAPGSVVALRTRTLGRPIELGTADSATALGLTDAELDRITASHIVVSETGSGSIGVKAVLSPTTYQTLAFATDVTFFATGGFSSLVGPTAANYARMAAAANVAILPGVSLNFAATGGYSARPGDLFTFLTVGGAPLTSGFTTPALTNFLGSTYTATLTYTGGAGNDLVIGLAPVPLSNLAYALNPARYLRNQPIAPNTLSYSGGPLGTVAIVPSFVRTWGGSGSAPGEFNNPTKVVTDPAGNIYVADANNDRIQKFGPDGTFLFALGTSGNGPGQFSGPLGLAVDPANGNIYVCDNYNHRIQKFDAAGNFLLAWGSFGEADGQLRNPRCAAVDAAGNLYVLEQTGQRVQKFDANGNFLLKFGAPGNGDGLFSTALGLALGPDGSVYVADAFASQVQKFDANGNFLLRFGGGGPQDGQFTYCWDVAVDRSGRVYATDLFGYRIQVFTSSGTFLTKFGRQGSDNGGFASQQFLTVDYAGNVICGEEDGTRIQVFAPALLPGGLNLDPATGTISGTPAAVAAAADYTITATNSLGSASTTLRLAVVAPDYLVTTTGGTLSVVDAAGRSNALGITEPAAGSIAFAAPGRDFVVDGLLVPTGSSGNLPLAGIGSIVVDEAGGDDTITVEAFASPLPQLTLNGGSGNDTVHLNGSLTFVSGASFAVNLPDDPAAALKGAINVAANVRIAVAGAGSIALTASRSIASGPGVRLEALDGGIALTANAAGTAAGNFSGVSLAGSTLFAGGSGNITITGRGGNDAATSSHFGVYIGAVSELRAAGTGSVLLDGQGGLGLSGNFGLFVSDDSLLAASSGLLRLHGLGGVGTGTSNSGILLANRAKVTALGSATIEMVGEGGTGSSVIRGLEVGGSSVVTTQNGSLSLRGTGGLNAAGVQSIGVFVGSGGSISSTGSGPITLDGTGGGGSGQALGVLVGGANSNVTSVSGAITLTGRAQPGNTGSFNSGVAIKNGGRVVSTGTGASAASITIAGTGGGSAVDNFGFDGESSVGFVSSIDGPVRISGVTTSASSPGITIGYPGNAPESIVLTGTATLELQADTLRIVNTSASISAGSNGVRLLPFTAGRAIELGGTTNPAALNLLNADLARIACGTLTIGGAASGPITVSGVLSPNSFGTLAFGKDVTFAPTGGFVATVGPTAATYARMTALGTVTIQPGATLALQAVGGYVAAPGDAFLLLDNDGTDPIAGTFSISLTNLLGSNLTGQASYLGGSGNDLTIAAGAAPVFLTAVSTIFQLGQNNAFGLLASGLPAPTLALTAGTLPSGVIFTPATGLLSGLPGAGTAGVYPLVFTASNGVNPAATQNFTLTVNRPPVVNAVGYQTTKDVLLSLPRASLLAAASDADGDPITLVSVTPGTGPGAGNVFLTAAGVTYTPKPGFTGTDAFTFLVSDGRGGHATGTATVTIKPAMSAGGLSIGSVLISPSGGVVNAFGTSGLSYTLEYSDNLTGTWTPFQTLTANEFGGLTFTESLQPRPARRFYRVR